MRVADFKAIHRSIAYVEKALFADIPAGIFYIWDTQMYPVP